MLERHRTYISIFRAFSRVNAKLKQGTQNQMLVAQPAKLQKMIEFGKNPRWLHQDVKIGNRTIQQALNMFQMHELAKQSFYNTKFDIQTPHIDRFCNECSIRLGVENFKRFVEFNEHQVKSLKKLTNFEKYIPICFKIFNNDAFLVKLLAMCNLKKISRKNLYENITHTNLDSDDTLQIYKLIPNEKLIFDSYKNFDELLSNDERSEKDEKSEKFGNDEKSGNEENKEDEENENIDEELSEIAQKKFIIDSIITIHQIPSDPPKRTNWVYFQLESGIDDMLTEEGVMSTFNKLGIETCQNLLVFKPQYQSQRAPIQTKRISSQELKDSLSEDIDFSRLAILARSNSSTPSKRPEVEDEALSGNFSSHSSELEKDAKKFEDMIKFCSKVNNRSRAYGFAEFETFEEKEKLLRNVYRLFGIEYQKAFLVVDDADNKKIIQLNNIPWNLNPKNFAGWLNEISKNNGHSMKFGYEPGLENFLSDSSYFYLKMNSFPEALTIMQIINASDYANKKINAWFKRGCGRYVNGILIDNYISPNMEKNHKVHIERRTKLKEAYVKRIGNCLYQSYDMPSMR
jgi:hypothetical protein